MHPNNRLTVNAIEAYPLDDFSPDVSASVTSRSKACLFIAADISILPSHPSPRQAIRAALSEAQKNASGSGSAEQKAEAEIEVEVLTALQSAMGRS